LPAGRNNFILTVVFPANIPYNVAKHVDVA